MKIITFAPDFKIWRIFAPLQTLQGRVKFPIGGKVRKPLSCTKYHLLCTILEARTVAITVPTV